MMAGDEKLFASAFLKLLLCPWISCSIFPWQTTNELLRKTLIQVVGSALSSYSSLLAHWKCCPGGSLPCVSGASRGGSRRRTGHEELKIYVKMIPGLFCSDTDRHGDGHRPPFSLLTFWVIFFTFLTLELGCFSRNEERWCPVTGIFNFSCRQWKKNRQGRGGSYALLWHCAWEDEQMSPHPRKERNDRLKSNSVNKCIIGITYRSVGAML